MHYMDHLTSFLNLEYEIGLLNLESFTSTILGEDPVFGFGFYLFEMKG